MPVNYATAWAALHGYGSLRAGERVLVHAAAGGVGAAAVQLAKAAGAIVHGTASPGKRAQLAAMGIDRRCHRLPPRRLALETACDPSDIVLDALGGTSLRRSFGMLPSGADGLWPMASRRCNKAKSGRKSKQLAIVLWRCCAF